MTNITLKISGMSCGHCVARVEKALSELEGVATANVNLEKNTATIEYDESKTGPANFIKAVAEAGYKAEE